MSRHEALNGALTFEMSHASIGTALAEKRLFDALKPHAEASGVENAIATAGNFAAMLAMTIHIDIAGAGESELSTLGRFWNDWGDPSLARDGARLWAWRLQLGYLSIGAWMTATSNALTEMTKYSAPRALLPDALVTDAPDPD